MSGPLGFITNIIKPVTGLIDSLHTSDEEKLEAKSVLLKLETALMSQTLSYEQKLAESQASIIVAEATANSWLTRTWRCNRRLDGHIIIICKCNSITRIHFFWCILMCQ